MRRTKRVGLAAGTAALVSAACAASTVAPPTAAPELACAAPLQPHLRATLYMGSGNRHTGVRVSDEEWQRFVDEVLLRYFPDGGTVVDSSGWWRRNPGSTGSTGSSASRMLVLLHPVGGRAEFVAAVRSVIVEIKERYGHQSVLWEEARVCATF